MYTPSDFPPFAVTVDLVVLTVRGDALCALLVRRGEASYRGRWALPGGFVQPTESVDAAAVRELLEETGVSGLHLEQLGTYGEPRRDPRMRVVSVAYLALAPDLPVPVAGTDAAAASWVPVGEASSLAFDHDRILGDGVERARAKLEYTALGTAFCGAEFTVAELRRVYEIVWGVSLDPRNFHRKVTGVDGLLTPTGESTSRDGGRPAALFRRGPAEVLYPPLVRAPVA
ncbi:NUDIX domain-containing protein [Lentzea sp. NPDC102401]|uniref:NUDIX hydrolase n=1 Tax=Lentzea sp. NPDC102401 TaxID=3364128 RepID=UPI00381C798B